jgi:hypothetical protein
LINQISITTLLSHNTEEKDAIIKLLQWKLGILKEQVEEFNDQQFLVIKVSEKKQSEEIEG